MVSSSTLKEINGSLQGGLERPQRTWRFGENKGKSNYCLDKIPHPTVALMEIHSILLPFLFFHFSYSLINVTRKL